MDDARDANRTIDWRRQFAWLHMFRVFRIAVDPRKMLLAGLGLLALSAGDWAVDRMPFTSGDRALSTEWPWDSPADRSDILDADNGWTEMTGYVAANWHAIWRPLAEFVGPLRMLLQPELKWPGAAHALTKLLWSLLVWSLFGGAITRMAAVQFAREEQVGIWNALRYSGARLFLYFSAPLLPLAAIAFFWALCWGGGLVGRIPVAGEVIVGALWFLALICGLLMALILIGAATSWPLMFATISAEGSDAFDGLSRSYSYVFGRPWRFVWYSVIATVSGSVLVAVVAALFSLTVYLSGWAVGTGLGHEKINTMSSAAPASVDAAADAESQLKERPGKTSVIGGMLLRGWLRGAVLLKAGFACSFFWSAMTIIYFLLRQSDDATDLNEIFMPEHSDDDELLPLVGVANSNQPVIERPAPEIPESRD